MNIKLLLLIAAFSFSNQASATYWGIPKCHRTEWKMAFMDRSPEEFKSGEKWALKCYPYLEYSLKDGKFIFTDSSTGQETRATPMFARVDEKGEIIERLAAPVDPEASCDETIHVAGFCEAPHMY